MTATQHPYLDVLNTRFAGVLAHGAHAPDGVACALEVASIARGKKWSDSPAVAGLPDLRPLNDGPWPSDRERTRALVPVVVALWDWSEWSPARRKAFAAAVAERTIRELLPPVLRAVGLNAEARRCQQEGTAAAARAAADAYAYAAADAAADAAAADADAARAAAYAAYAARDAAYAARAVADAAARKPVAPVTLLRRACRLWIEAAEVTA